MKLNKIERNIISLDARASGYQHLSSLFNIEGIGECVGLSNNNNSDFYRVVSIKVIQTLPSPLKEKCIKIRTTVRRQLFKKPLMVYIYGARMLTMRDYLYENAMKYRESIMLRKDESMNIVMSLRKVLNDIVGYPVQTIIGQCIDENNNIILYPDGFKLKLIYKKIQRVKINTQYNLKRYSYYINYERDK